MSSAATSFMITDREWAAGPTTGTPIDDGHLMWFSAPGANVTDSRQFNADSSVSSTAPSATYDAAIVAALSGQASPSLTLFIHGLDCPWDSAVSFTAGLGVSLAAQGYAGLVIGYSWPSVGSGDLTSYSNGYPPTASTSTVRGKIAYGAPGVANLMAWLVGLQARVSGLSVNIVCHSEGNYVLMYSLMQAGASGIDQIIMLAADVNDGLFLTDGGDSSGQGAAIAAACAQVTVYFTRCDYTLGFSLGVYGAPFPVFDHLGGGAFHNPTFAGRLGLSGPAYAAGPQSGSMVSVDCSAVLNDTALASHAINGSGIHTSYFFVDQVLADVAAVLLGQGADGITNRVVLAYSGAYAMTPT